VPEPSDQPAKYSREGRRRQLNIEPVQVWKQQPFAGIHRPSMVQDLSTRSTAETWQRKWNEFFRLLLTLVPRAEGIENPRQIECHERSCDNHYGHKPMLSPEVDGRRPIQHPSYEEVSERIR
jgi:hypothetical protein